MFANAVLLVVLLACGAEFGTTYEIFPFSIPNNDDTIQKDEIIDDMTKSEISAINSPHDVPVDYDSNVPDPGPFPEEDKLNSDSMYPMGSPLHPFFYDGAHTDSSEQFPSLNVDGFPAEPFRPDFSYSHYQPPPHNFPSVDPYELEEIRYVPLTLDEMELNKPAVLGGSTQQPPTADTLPPIPYLSMTTPSTVTPPSKLEEDMIKTIVQIVNEFRKYNITQLETIFQEKPAATTDTGPVRFTVTEADDTKDDESKVLQIDISENRTKIGLGEKIDPDQNLDLTTFSPATTPTVKPFRYVVSQFIDSHGNPCAKEFVMTSTKKSYYVYTCEEKSVPVPRATKSPSSLFNYKNELQTTDPDVSPSSQDAVTNPMMAEDQTLPEMMNDYMVYNKE